MTIEQVFFSAETGKDYKIPSIRLQNKLKIKTCLLKIKRFLLEIAGFPLEIKGFPLEIEWFP